MERGLEVEDVAADERDEDEEDVADKKEEGSERGLTLASSTYASGQLRFGAVSGGNLPAFSPVSWPAHERRTETRCMMYSPR